MRRLLAATALVASSAAAQGTVTVTGTIRPAGARIRQEFGDYIVISDSNGAFRFPVLARARIRLLIEAFNYVTDTVVIPPLPDGTIRRLHIVLRPLPTLEKVEVTARGDRPLIDVADATVAGAVDRTDLANISTDARDPIDVALSIPGVTRGVGFFDFAPKLDVDGANSLYTPYRIDGMDNSENYLGGPKILLPLDAVQMVDVSASIYGASIGKSANGVVDFETRRGGDVWSGNAVVDGRPASAFRRLQGAASEGGPLVPGATYVFGAADYAVADSAVPYDFGDPRFGSGSGNSHRTTLKLFGRLDQQWSATQTTTLDLAFSSIGLIGQGGGVVTREADQTQNRVAFLGGLHHESTFGGWTNTAAAEVSTYHYYYPPSTTPFSTPQVNIVPSSSNTTIATVGSAGFLFDEQEIEIQLANTLRRIIGAHAVQFGAAVQREQFSLAANNTNPAGTYTVVDSGLNVHGGTVSIADIPANDPARFYTIDANPQQIHGMNVLVGAFAEDAWSVSPRLTIDYGLRWDYDDLTSKGRGSPQLDNFQPRASFNWHPTANEVIRGGAGIYVGHIPFTTFTDARQFARNGDNVVTFSNVAFGHGPTPAQVQAAMATEPAREIRELYYFGAKDPQSYQTSLGYQRRLGDWGFSLDGMVVGTKYLPRIWDLNAPPCLPPCPPAEMQRPDGANPGSYSFHTTTDFGGQSIYWAVIATVRHQFAANWTADVSYTLSRDRDNTEDINFAAEYANDFHNEWADAVNDRRHHVQARTVYTVLDRLKLSTIIDFTTGAPQNVVAPIGTDYTGSQNFMLTANSFDYNYQRVPGTPRDSQRLPSEFDQSVGIRYELPIGVSLRADVFNVWNETLVSGFVNNVPGGGPRTLILQSRLPQVSGIRRAVQFGATYSF
ncbi:MAG TPA: TonB-dependent receptor [Gemmatimonadaceae bacterium]|nr:TonB-dependent receptor [Gemmatimonadaceae bacterium]